MTSRNSYMIEKGRNTGLRIGKKYEEKYFEYYQKYRCRGYKKGVAKGVQDLVKNVEAGKEIEKIIDKHQLKLDWAVRRLKINKGIDATTRKNLERTILLEKMFLELLNEVADVEDFNEFAKGVKYGIKVAIGIKSKN